MKSRAVETESRPGPKVGLIATIPKSGTWYCHYFFHFYQQYLRGADHSGLEVTIQPHRAPDLGLDIMFISHTVCPGFYAYQGEWRSAWDRLTFRDPAYNWAMDLINDRPHWYDPGMNENARIVLIYRNPLDQAVSYFQYAQNHREGRKRHYRDEAGELRPLESAGDYLRHVGLESYVKQFLSFRIMRDYFPDRILMLSYESLLREARDGFFKILKHFGHNPGLPQHHPRFSAALEASGMGAMKQLEDRLGRSLANDRLDPAERHVRDGAVGKWRRHLNPADIQAAIGFLKRFKISLEEFELI